eukprot:UN01744
MAQRIVQTIDKLLGEISTINEGVKTIGTHHGTFHCDEVLACFMLRNHTKEFRNADIIRSRDPDILSTADIVVDVGAEFDLNSNKFDHHQNTFCETFSSDFDTKLSSAGLIYKYFGKEIIRDIIIKHSDDIQTNMDAVDKKEAELNDNILNVVYKKVYKSFIEGIDGIDNGVQQYQSANDTDTNIEKRYAINTDLSSRVSAFNPWWNQESNDDIVMKQFDKAVLYVGDEFIKHILYVYKGWLPARDIVENVIKNRFAVDKSGQILLFDEFCPWIEHLYEIHKETPIDPMPIYVLFQDQKKGWRVRAVPVEVGSFATIKALPKIWCGKRGDPLNQICGIHDCVFVHTTGFIGGNKTYQGALEMARKALQF